MRWFKFSLIVLGFLMAIYAISMLFIDESKNFTIEKEVNYPVEKVFPQFNNLQNFSAWNDFFASNDKLSLNFFTPYEGQGSSMSFSDKKNSANNGDVFIRYDNPNKTLRFQLLQGKKSNPYLIDIKFKPISTTKTKIIWYLHTPKQPFLKRSLNLFTEDFFVNNINKSMNNLVNLLGNKVDKEKEMASIKYDSLMIEKQNTQILLGINVSTSNKKDLFFKNIILNHNKILNYVKTDLGKKEDEFGLPILLIEPNNFKDKEVSYFYGIPLSKKVSVSDNNFSFRTLNASKIYVIYFKGNYSSRVKSIQQLMLKAKRDTMRNGELQETFIEAPKEEKDCVIKFSLPVYK